MQYKEWLAEWLETYIEPTVKKRTYIQYRDIAKRHIEPQLGAYEMDRLSPIGIQKCITQLLQNGNAKNGKGLSANTVNCVISVIRNSLSAAHGLGYTCEYIGDKIKRPKIFEKKINCFSLEEQRHIERAVLSGNKLKFYGIVVCLYTGLRIGELLALTWSDIDFRTNEINVGKTCYDCKAENGRFARLIDAPKTETSVRTVPMARQLAPILQRLKSENKSEYVVAENGKVPSVRAYQDGFERLLKKNGIRHRGFHSLRHTFATRALECGMDVKTLSEILGHKNPTVTLTRYTHSMPAHKKMMIDRVGRLLC
ncbi:MAG: hypothetical protein DBX97_03105 [Collinsella tanakaei]|nr:MAG: hypothetical protein DBX97_03105 [Collinsella tanakaei]